MKPIDIKYVNPIKFKLLPEEDKKDMEIKASKRGLSIEDLVFAGFEIKWDTGEKTHHNIYEPSCSLIYKDNIVILLGHEELLIVEDGRTTAHMFIR